MSQAGPKTAYPRNKKIEIKDPSTGKDITETLINIVYPDHTAIEEVKDPLQSGVPPTVVVWSTHDGYNTGGGVCSVAWFQNVTRGPSHSMPQGEDHHRDQGPTNWKRYY
ncbi:hypothetical protein PoB_004963600 [Plakobranchus ocellatus]|uniref:Uncharacterized protein n=1 Tax=Plakobranchus ocellatus TaxID=259542 RepID=A0AAV4BVL7_9GAST|nr:hypothetical protein PoB_004963600 [Plakobranchus ocellatus]